MVNPEANLVIVPLLDLGSRSEPGTDIHIYI